MNYFKATLLPEIDNQPDPNCFIEHMTNNYYEKFSEFKNQNYMDIRGVCTLKINDIFEDLKEVKDNFFLVKLFKLLKWKFRFISRKFNCPISGPVNRLIYKRSCFIRIVLTRLSHPLL